MFGTGMQIAETNNEITVAWPLQASWSVPLSARHEGDTMSKLLTALIASCGIAFASAAGAQAMTKQAYEAQNDKVEAMYKADKERCDTLAGNTKDVCQAQAKAKRDIAKADNEATFKNTADARRDASIKRADAEYDVAKERCDDLSGNAKDVCQKDAKAAHERAKAAVKS